MISSQTIKTAILMLAAFLTLAAAPPLPAQDLGDHDIVSFEKTPQTTRLLQRLQLDLLLEKDGRVYAVVGGRDLLRGWRFLHEARHVRRGRRVQHGGHHRVLLDRRRVLPGRV